MAAFQTLASDKYKREAGRLGRNVLQQFLACHLPDKQLKDFGFYEELVTGPSLLIEAVRAWERRHQENVNRDSESRQ